MGVGRKSFKEQPVLKTWEDADLNLAEIAEIDMKLLAVEADMNLKIAEAKQAAFLQEETLKERKEKLAHEIKEFAENNRSEFIDMKTKILTFGKVGFRQSTSIVISKVNQVIEALKIKAMLDCITVKESVNKEVLRNYPDEVIAAVGARKKVEDVFWLEPDYEKLK